MAKDDYIKITTKGGQPLQVIADKGGRRVEGEWEPQGIPKASWFIARLLTRGGTEIKHLEVPAVEIVSIEVQIKPPTGD